ncbi:unnamed protein product, partial [Pelagomonas calceolata]
REFNLHSRLPAKSLEITTLDRDAALAHAVDERLHAAVEEVLVAAREAVEVEFVEALGLGALGQERADAARRGPVVPLGVLRFDALVERRRRADGVTLLIVDDLGVDVVVRPEHVQAQPALVLRGRSMSAAVSRAKNGGRCRAPGWRCAFVGCGTRFGSRWPLKPSLVWVLLAPRSR